MKRELDLIDVWFDSGSMPYAQWGLDYDKLAAGEEQPFKAPFDQSYPANFIAEGVDQTRGWFYTLHAIAVMAYDTVAPVPAPAGYRLPGCEIRIRSS